MRVFLLVLRSLALALSVIAQGLQPPLAMYLTSADGTTIYAEAQGNVSAPSVIFAHGIFGTALVFDGLFSRADLQKAAYLVRYDARGHGRSGKPTDAASYESVRYAQDVEAVVKAFNLTMPFFAGWSLGGVIFADIVDYWPSPLPFLGLIYISPVPYLDNSTLPLTDLAKALLPPLTETNDSAVALSSRTELATYFSVKGAAVDFATLTSWSGGAMLLLPAIASLVFFRTQNYTPLLQLGESGFPTLLVHGENDRIINTFYTTAIVKQNFTNLQASIYPQAGHACFYDQPEAVAFDIINFVESNT